MPKARVLKKYMGGGGSNELEDLVFRLSLELPIEKSKNIVQKLNVSDMSSFKNNTAMFIDKKSLSVILNMIKEINKEEDILTYNLNMLLGSVIRIDDIDNDLNTIKRTLRLNNIYDLIDATPNDINVSELPQIYKDKLLKLRIYLKNINKIYTFLMKTKFLTQHEAIYVSETLGILKPDDLKHFTVNDINSIKKLTKEKKGQLLVLIEDILNGKKETSSSSS
jgi:hypothetical protein